MSISPNDPSGAATETPGSQTRRQCEPLPTYIVSAPSTAKQRASWGGASTTHRSFIPEGVLAGRPSVSSNGERVLLALERLVRQRQGQADQGRHPAAKTGLGIRHQPCAEGLPVTWRKQAKTVRRYAGETPAMVLDRCADGLETTGRELDETTLSLVGRLVRDGKIPQRRTPRGKRRQLHASRKGACRLARQSHLPTAHEGDRDAWPS